MLLTTLYKIASAMDRVFNAANQPGDPMKDWTALQNNIPYKLLQKFPFGITVQKYDINTQNPNSIGLFPKPSEYVKAQEFNRPIST